MALDSILAHIQAESDGRVQAIIAEARRQAEKLLREGKLAAEKQFRESLRREQNAQLQKKQRALVACRLENRKRILLCKQEALDGLFAKLKAELEKNRIQKLVVTAQGDLQEPENVDFFLARLRWDLESEIAAILFS
jgi:V/A-type H+-transporting ATPase subunit E